MNPEHDPYPATGRDPAQDPGGALDWARRRDRLGHFLKTFERRLQNRRRRRRQTAMAGLAALFALGFAWQIRDDPIVHRPEAPEPAVVMQPARHNLPDGTVVELMEGAEFAAEFSAVARRVVLRHGVAYFQVAKDAKPFVVVAGDVEVRAVGTAFSVHLRSEGIEVLVTDGRVAVGQGDRTVSGQADGSPQGLEDGKANIADGDDAHFIRPPSPAPVHVAAGHRVIIETSAQGMQPRVIPVTPAEREQLLSWRIPRLEFNGTPLLEVVATINRHSRVQLEVAGAEAGQVEVSGFLRADNIEPLLIMLEGHYGLRVRRAGDRVILTLPEASGH